MTEELNQQREHDKEYFELFEERDKLIQTQIEINKAYSLDSDRKFKEIQELSNKTEFETAFDTYKGFKQLTNIFLSDRDERQTKIDEIKAKISEAKRQKKRQIEFLEKVKKHEGHINCDCYICEEIKILKMEVERE